MNKWKKNFENGLNDYLKDYFKLLSFKSIGVDPEFRQECKNCAIWLKDLLNKIGLKSEIIETDTNPLVYGEYLPKDAKSITLFYGHYDVQPVDPISEWITEPFSPDLRDGRVYARGAQDNKGQIFYCIKAVEEFIKSNPNIGIKFLIEGEEESGSGALTKMIPDLKSKLSADNILVIDLGSRSPNIPTITLGMRGILNYSFKLTGANHDLHSGVHGGIAPNPAQFISKLVSTLHNEDGSIAIQGYYDDVIDPTEHENDILEKNSFSVNEYQQMIGTYPSGGEKDLDLLVRVGFRPTIEINGVHSGFSGPGHKTVIPSEAICFISGRLAFGQDPKKCLESLDLHLRKNLVDGFKFEVIDAKAEAPAFRISPNVDIIKKSLEVLTNQIASPILAWEGASIPIVAKLSTEISSNILLSGFGLEEDHIHAPNESFSLKQIELGYCFIGELLEKL